MSISEYFIRRRIGTMLLVIGVLLVGMVSYFSLPVAPLPQVEFPTIQVSASLPGASAETMATSVAAPLERAFSSVSGLTDMTSSSSLGNTSISLQFDLSKSLDSAAQDVQTAINAAGGNLPRNLPHPPTYEKTNPADFTIMSLALTSDTLPLTELSRFADEYVAPRLGRLSGVGMIDYHGERRPSVRIQLDPDRIAALGLTSGDVRTVISQQTVNAPKGSLNSSDRAIVLNATDQLMNADAYKSLVVAYRNGAPILLSDVGTVVDAPEDIRQGGWYQGKPAVIIDIHKQPGYNVVNTNEGIKAALPGLIANLPPSAKLTVAGDRTQTIRASVNDVQVTMLITGALVIGVILIFLRNLRATIIAGIAIPLSVIATFAVMYVAGYSLDNLSLMGLTIAVSFVVDDAIVVIENVNRHLEQGVSRMQAAIDGSKEISFTVISMTVSLIAVFIPILFMGGIIGRLFREFAVTISIALVISGIVSLTVTPMLCAWLLDHLPEGKKQSRFFQLTERVFDAMLDGYRRGLDVVLRHPLATILTTGLVVVVTGALYVAIPKGFFPQVDTGLIFATTEAAPDSGYDAMAAKTEAAARIAREDPAVDNVFDWVGPSLSRGRIAIDLKPVGQRDATAAQVQKRLAKKMAAIEGLEVHMQIRQDLQIGGRSGSAQYQYTLQSGDIEALGHWADVLKKKLGALPQIADISSDAEKSALSSTLVIDRTTASRLGVTAQAVDDALYDAFGQRQVATLFTQLNQYHVIEEVQPRFQLTREALDHIQVRSSLTNTLVPMSMLAKVETGLSPVSIAHQGSFPAVTLSFNLAPGYALGDAVTAIQKVELDAGMPATVTGSFQGSAQVFQSSLKSQPWLILAAFIAVYIVLGILYESAIHPLTIISTLPSAGLGALLALLLFGDDLSIIGMIGIILLIGIVKKNAIMMIDFALAAEREQGLPPEEAIRQGALLRFRPIMMTTVAALLGALPLALGSGAGAELRQPLGISIAGGLIVSQVLTLFSTPVIYLWFDRLRLRLGRWRTRQRETARYHAENMDA